MGERGRLADSSQPCEGTPPRSRAGSGRHVPAPPM